MYNLCSVNDRGNFIRVIEFNYPFLELSKDARLTARGPFSEDECVQCVQSLGFQASSANPQRLCCIPHCQAHFKPCWVLSPNLREKIPIITSHKSLYFDHFSPFILFLSLTLLFSVLYMTRSVYCLLQSLSSMSL